MLEDFSSPVTVFLSCALGLSGLFGLYASTKTAALDRMLAILQASRRDVAFDAVDLARNINDRHDISFMARLIGGSIIAAMMMTCLYGYRDGISFRLLLPFISIPLGYVAAFPLIRASRRLSGEQHLVSKSLIPSFDEIHRWKAEDVSGFAIVGFLFGIWSAFKVTIAVLGLISLIPQLNIPSPLGLLVLTILR